MTDINRSASTANLSNSLPIRVLRWTLFPAFIGIASLAVAAIHFRILNAMAVQMIVFGLSVAALLLAERYVPFSVAWKQVNKAERRVDFTSWLVLMMFVDPFVKRVLLPFLFSALIGATQPAGLGWFPTDWPIAAQVLLALLIAEFGQYWIHRAAHTHRWMWGVHTFHHNPARLYWLNGFRVNPINMIWHQLSGLLVLMVIGTPAEVVQMLVVVSTVIAAFQHANADLRYDGWNLFLSTADLHRWHHAATPGDANCNFGASVILWDRLFGTYRRQAQAPSALGVAGQPACNIGYWCELHRSTRLPVIAGRAWKCCPGDNANDSASG